MSHNVSSLLTDLSAAVRSTAKEAGVAPVAYIAALMDCPLGTISAWKSRQSIPIGYWRKFITVCHRFEMSHVTSDTLVAAHAPEQPEQVAS